MLIKRVLSVFIFLYIFSFSVSSAPFYDVSAKSAILMNHETKEVIYEKNATSKMSMASTTKIMTSIIAIESGKLDCVVVAKKDSTVEGTAIGIKKGNAFTLRTLVYAMLLESGNDAAILVAEYLAGSEKEFAKMMNKKADEIGMSSTHFVTASGLDDSEHYTTAYDMALLGSYVIENPVFRQICSAKTYTAEYISPKITANYSNHNKLLRSYDGVFGIKTGFTKKSGRCLVTACKKDDATLIAVTLKAPDDWNDHMKMYDFGHTAVSDIRLSVDVPDKIRVYSSEVSETDISLTHTEFSGERNAGYKYRVIMPEWLYAPVKKNEIIGYVEILNGDKIIKRVEITADKDVQGNMESKDKPEYGFFYKIKQLFS